MKTNKKQFNLSTMILLSTITLAGCNNGSGQSSSDANVNSSNILQDTTGENKSRQNLASTPIQSYTYNNKDASESTNQYQLILAQNNVTDSKGNKIPKKITSQAGDITFFINESGVLTSEDKSGNILWSAQGGDILGADLSAIKCFAIRSEKNLVEDSDAEWNKKRKNKQEPKYTKSIRLVGLNKCDSNATYDNEVITTDNIVNHKGINKIVFADNGDLIAYNESGNKVASGMTASVADHFIFSPGKVFANNAALYMGADYQKRYINYKIAQALALDDGEVKNGTIYSNILFCDTNKKLPEGDGNFLAYYRNLTGCQVDDSGNITSNRIKLSDAKNLIPLYMGYSNSTTNNLAYGADFKQQGEILTYNKASGQTTLVPQPEDLMGCTLSNNSAESNALGACTLNWTYSDTNTYTHTFNFSSTQAFSFGEKTVSTFKESLFFEEGTGSFENSWSWTFSFTEGYSNASTQTCSLTRSVSVATQANYIVPPGGKLVVTGYRDRAAFNLTAYTPFPLNTNWISMYAIDQAYGFDPIALNKVNTSSLMEIINDKGLNSPYAPLITDHSGTTSMVDYGIADASVGEDVEAVITVYDKNGNIYGQPIIKHSTPLLKANNWTCTPSWVA